jgi:hypothetical protein
MGRVPFALSPEVTGSNPNHAARHRPGEMPQGGLRSWAESRERESKDKFAGAVSDELSDNHRVRGRTFPDSRGYVSRSTTQQPVGPIALGLLRDEEAVGDPIRRGEHLGALTLRSSRGVAREGIRRHIYRT